MVEAGGDSDSDNKSDDSDVEGGVGDGELLIHALSSMLYALL